MILMIQNPKIFVAGATGAIGFKLCLILKQHHYEVFGSTRSHTKAQYLEAIGVHSIIMDVFDREQLFKHINHISPEIIIHQLTDLPYALTPALMQEARVRNAHIRDVGTKNLLLAAHKTECKKFIAQSIAFAYDPNQLYLNENSALAIHSEDKILRKNAESIQNMESQIINSGLNHVILRYGKLYGAATGCSPLEYGKIHIDAAAYAAFLAIHSGHGIYQIVENDKFYSNEKAQKELNFNEYYRWKF